MEKISKQPVSNQNVLATNTIKEAETKTVSSARGAKGPALLQVVNEQSRVSGSNKMSATDRAIFGTTSKTASQGEIKGMFMRSREFVEREAILVSMLKSLLLLARTGQLKALSEQETYVMMMDSAKSNIQNQAVFNLVSSIVSGAAGIVGGAVSLGAGLKATKMEAKGLKNIKDKIGEFQAKNKDKTGEDLGNVGDNNPINRPGTSSNQPIAPDMENLEIGQNIKPKTQKEVKSLRDLSKMSDEDLNIKPEQRRQIDQMASEIHYFYSVHVA